MSWILRFRLREHLRTASWPIPCGFGLVGLFAGMLVWRLDRWARWSVLDFEPGAAAALTTAIVGATLTFLGTAFAVLLVVVQFASTQLTPRAIRVSLGDPLYRITLGLFVATFVYAMIILARTTQTFVPQLGVSLAAMLSVISLGAYLVLIGHLRRSLRPVIVSARVGREGRRTIQRLYPALAGRPEGAPPAATDGVAAPELTRTVHNPGPPGILVAFDVAGLVAEARRADGRIMLVPAAGDFVRAGGLLFQLVETATPMDVRLLLQSVALGQERTTDRDPAFAFRTLVDIAIKALSPAINDPTSAVMAIDQLHELLADLGLRRLDIGQHRDVEGHVRLALKTPRWEDYVSLAVDEIRHCGAQQVQVTRRLRAMFDDLLLILPKERRAAVHHELGLLTEAVRRAFPDAEDQARACEPDQQGIGSSPARGGAPPARRR